MARCAFRRKEEAEKCRLKKEAEDAFHGQRLADDSARKPREARPVGAELELHGNAGDHAHDEVDAEDAAPKARRAIPNFAACTESHGLDHDDEQSQAHGELWKQIVEGDGEGKMQPVDDLGAHRRPPAVGVRWMGTGCARRDSMQPSNDSKLARFRGWQPTAASILAPDFSSSGDFDHLPQSARALILFLECAPSREAPAAHG